MAETLKPSPANGAYFRVVRAVSPRGAYVTHQLRLVRYRDGRPLADHEVPFFAMPDGDRDPVASVAWWLRHAADEVAGTEVVDAAEIGRG